MFICCVIFSISYMISECIVDVARTKADYEQIKQLINELKEKKEGDS